MSASQTETNNQAADMPYQVDAMQKKSRPHGPGRPMYCLGLEIVNEISELIAFLVFCLGLRN
jgi:hypothetical protein